MGDGLFPRYINKFIFVNSGIMTLGWDRVGHSNLHKERCKKFI